VSWRELTEYETSLLNRMLENDFPGRDELRAQVEDCLVETVESYGDDYGSIRFKAGVEAPGPGWHNVAVTATAMDRDGIPISYLLHVIDGSLLELEIVKNSDDVMKRRPERAEWM
jgi:Domain of unknown function (DUF6984)